MRLRLSSLVRELAAFCDYCLTRRVDWRWFVCFLRAADPIKVLTVRSTAFEKAATEGGSAEIEEVDTSSLAGKHF